MFAGKARSLPLGEAPEKCFTRVYSGLTRNDQAKLQSRAADQHSSLLQKFVDNDCKKCFTFKQQYPYQYKFHEERVPMLMTTNLKSVNLMCVSYNSLLFSNDTVNPITQVYNGID